MNTLTTTRTCFNYGCQKKGIDLKVCGQCKSAWYCSAECQKADWKKHKSDCKFLSAMKEQEENTFQQLCARCENKHVPLKKCSQCMAVHYCSKDCQVQHWREHKPLCQMIISGKKKEVVKQKPDSKDEEDDDDDDDDDDDEWEIAGIKGQDIWDEVQEKGFKMVSAYKEKEGLISVGYNDEDEDDNIANTLSQAERIAREMFDDRQKIVTNFESVPSELYGFRICQGQQVLVTHITGFHPETVRHGIFITDDDKMSSFVLFHMENLKNPQPYYKWSDVRPGNYLCIVDPSFQKFPGKYMGFVIDDASDIRVIKGRLLDSKDCQKLTKNMKTSSC